MSSTANPIPRDSDFMPDWARSRRVARSRIRGELRRRLGRYRAWVAANPLAARNEEILAHRRSGDTLRRIALDYGISTQRVREIVAATAAKAKERRRWAAFLENWRRP